MTRAALELVSPTLAWQLITCAHAVGLRQELVGASVSSRRNPPSAALGSAAHKVLELALSTAPLDVTLTAEWFEPSWASSIEHEQTLCIDPSPPERWRRYSIVRRGTRKVVHLLREQAGATSARPLVEVPLRSTQFPLWGKPDIVLAYPDGSADIIDFKTGAHNGAEPDPREQFQLDVYGALVSEVLQLDVRNVRIERCDGPPWSAAGDLNRSSEVVRQALDALAEYNRHRSDTSELAHPGPGCAHCPQADRCRAVWSARPDGFVGLDGVVESLVEEGELTTLIVQRGDHRTAVAACPSLDLSAGDEVRIAHLVDRGEGGFRWQPNRTLITCESAQ